MRAVEIVDLKKRYGPHTVLDGVSLAIDEGEAYALMGPNGSGKTTLSSILASVSAFDSGTVTIYGKKPEQVKELVGYVPQNNFSVLQLTGRENLAYFAGLLGYSGKEARRVVDDLLEKVGLSAEADKRVSHYSGGMRKRLEVATALFPGIRVLILDEPTTGLDPSARREFFTLLDKAGNRETCRLLVTHLGTDAELSSRVGLIDMGRIVAEGTPEALKSAYASKDVVTIDVPTQSAAILELLRRHSVGQEVSETRAGYRLYSDDGSQAAPEITQALSQAGIRVTRTEVTSPTLEDVFFRLTKRSVEEGIGA